MTGVTVDGSRSGGPEGMDSGVPDAGVADAGVAAAGVPDADAGVADAGVADPGRRAAVRAISRGLGATGVGVLAGGGGAGLFAGLVAELAAAAATDTALDIQVLQTASSLETLLVELYSDALGTGPLGTIAPSAKGLATMTDPVARDTLVNLLSETQARHVEHRRAFQTLTVELGGIEQNAANPKYASGAAVADVSSPLGLVDYAAVLEKIATDTYVVDLGLVDSVKAKEALAGVMAVAAQHLALWRTVGALIGDATPQLVRIPIGDDLVDLPGTLAAIAFPDAIGDLTSSSVAEPETGALVAAEATPPSTTTSPSPMPTTTTTTTTTPTTTPSATTTTSGSRP